MSFGGTNLNTKVARHVLGLFVLCTLLPAAAALALNYMQTAHRIRTESNERLRHQSRWTAEQVLERLRLVEIEFRRTVTRLANAPRDEWPASADSVLSGLTDLAVARGGSAPRRVYGGPSDLPALTAETRRHLEGGGTAVNALRVEGDPTRVVMIRSAELEGAASLIWGTVDTEWLAQAGTSFSGTTDVCLLDGSKSVIFCDVETIPDQIPLPGDARTSADDPYLTWNDGSTSYAGAYAIVSLPFEYAVEPWMAIALEPSETTAHLLSELRLTAMLVGFLGLVSILLFGGVHIRRSMRPLRSLIEATRRVLEGDLGARAEVSSSDEFGLLAGSFNDMTRRLQIQFRTLSALREVDQVALTNPPDVEIAETGLYAAAKMLTCRRAGLLIRSSNDSSFTGYLKLSADGELECLEGLVIDATEASMLLGEGLRIVQSAESKLLHDGPLAEHFSGHVALVAIKKDTRLAGLLVLGYDTGTPKTDELDRIRQLSDQLALALGSMRVIAELDALNTGTLEALAGAVDAKSQWTAGHSKRVTLLSLELGNVLGLSEEDLKRLHRGGLLHDIGKVGVPEAILDSPNRLSAEEWVEIKKHPMIGAQILAPIGAFADIIPIVRHHHEKWDGTGYPMGLSAMEIPRLARVLAVADVFDAMTSDRPYRAGMADEVALQIIEKDAGTHFDPVVARLLRPTLIRVGSEVRADRELADGEMADLAVGE